MDDNKGTIRPIKNKELNFISLLKSYTQEQELFSFFSFILSLLLSLVVVLMFHHFNSLDLTHKIVNNIFIASSAIFGIIIASFGLFAAITDKSFLKLINNLGQITNVLFPFWFCSLLWSILLSYCLVTSVLELDTENYRYLIFQLFFVLFLFFLSIGYTLSLIGDILKLTIHKANLIDVNISTIDAKKWNTQININKSYLIYLRFICVIGFLLITYDLFWLKFLKEFIVLTLVTGAFNLSYIYLYYKFINSLKKEKQIALKVHAKDIVKLQLLYIVVLTLLSI
ncbi:hypothetical protein PY093_16495 [Cytobacillus sp. S13-E01]|uniref:hypothetical protein n=1 Tax=Cytobacillus sp. S13-E01 TaxID=3031326 RepID=UPI0023D833AF|nr:hypothetical protein [Cytobacillus sp. S13-E01]MDF0728266.1 hypothetical protein [Cytobacillus sp. S13-E01]